MTPPVRWTQKRDRDGQLVPRCWVTDCGYTVAELRADDLVAFAVTAPGGTAPLAYRVTRDDVLAVIEAHQAGAAVDKFGAEGA